MNPKERVQSFIQLGKKITSTEKSEMQALKDQAFANNRWFDEKNVDFALDGLQFMLEGDQLENWLEDYELKVDEQKKVGIVMAGNIPMVGFHDLMTVLLSGHIAHVKMSSQDSTLMSFLITGLCEINPSFENLIEIRTDLKNIDAVIATGSDNTSRYFEYYFSKIPRLIRKNRSSIAILNGSETGETLKKLGEDLYSYYGLGCRNVSKILIPKGYRIQILLDALQDFNYILDNNKYRNNYDYHKSILLVNREDHFDTGFSLFKPSKDFVSPTSVTYYEEYGSNEEINSILKKESEKIQCVIGESKTEDQIPFGKAQKPFVWDYADNVDTMKFLLSL